jgi:hypothetical protein
MHAPSVPKPSDVGQSKSGRFLNLLQKSYSIEALALIGQSRNVTCSFFSLALRA